MARIKTPSPNEVATNPVLFAERFLRIQTLSMETIPLRLNSIQKKYLQQRTSRDLILKPRQVGISTVIQGEFRRYEWTRPTSTLTLCRDNDNTRDIRAMARMFYDNLPESFRPYREIANEVEATYPLLQSRSYIGKVRSKGIGRGGTRDRIHGSEVAWWEDAQSIISGALQGGSPVWVALESTANGQQGWFYEECLSALDGDSVWTLHFFAWWEEERYRIPLETEEVLVYTADELLLVEKHKLTPQQIKWRRAKIKELGGSLDAFLQEYPEDPRTCFRKSGAGYFGDVEFCFTAPMNAAPNKARRYVAGLDFGQQKDYTALIVIDTETLQMVDLLRINQQLWREIRTQIIAMCKKWDVSLVWAEENSIGSVNIEALREEMATDGLRTALFAFNMNEASKPPLMGSLYVALHEGGLKLLEDCPVLKSELNTARSKLVRNGTVWTVESPRDKNGHGDTVVALALAWHGVSFVRA